VVKRHMCIRILHDDGEKETPCHFRVVDATDFDDVVAERDRLIDEVHAAELAHDAITQERDNLRASITDARLLIINAANWFENGCEIKHGITELRAVVRNLERALSGEGKK
jgi:hypothetical protein